MQYIAVLMAMECSKDNNYHYSLPIDAFDEEAYDLEDVILGIIAHARAAVYDQNKVIFSSAAAVEANILLAASQPANSPAAIAGDVA